MVSDLPTGSTDASNGEENILTLWGLLGTGFQELVLGNWFSGTGLWELDKELLLTVNNEHKSIVFGTSANWDGVCVVYVSLVFKIHVSYM